MSRQTPKAEATRWSEAVGWAAMLDEAKDTDLLHERLRAFRSWMRDEENIRIFDQVTRLEQDRALYRGHAVPTAAELEADDYDPSVPIEAWKERRIRKPARSGIWRAPRRLTLATAAGIVLMGLLVAMVMRMHGELAGTRDPWTRVFETSLAAHERFRLPDGSRITAAGATRIAVRYTREFREFDLDRGEALFEVRANAARPFRVHAGTGTITALGTTFDVRRDGPHVSVTVLDGLVQVDPVRSVQAPIWVPARLARGQRIAYEENGRATPVELNRAVDVGWERGQLRFERERLRSVIEAVNRYSRRRVVLDDVSVGDYLYSGSVLQSQVDDWISGLARIYAVRINDQGAKEVHIALDPARPPGPLSQGAPR